MTTLPDCMMPDGADPCAAHKKLQAENEKLKVCHAENFDRIMTLASENARLREREAELLGHIEDLELRVCRLKSSKAGNEHDE